AFIEKRYRQDGKVFRRCHPRDLLTHAINLMHFEKLPYHYDGAGFGPCVRELLRAGGTRHRHDSSRVPRSRDRSPRGFTVPAREVLPGVLSRIQDAPLTGQGPAGTATCAPARTRRRRCHTASWRPSPPLRAARSLNVAVLDAIPIQKQVCRFPLSDKTRLPLFAKSQRRFLVLL